MIFVKKVFAQELSQIQETSPKFLNVPFNFNINVSQGWIYSWDGSIHWATDFSCKGGIKILAAADGLSMQSIQKPKKSGDQTYGNFVLIKHDNGYATLYGHLAKINEKIKIYPDWQRSNTNYSEWTPIKKGDYIGDCGMSGTDNVHLHFEVSTGKYAVGRVDSYDLYKTKEYYPPNKLFTAMGPKNLWATNPPTFNGDVTSIENTENSADRKDTNENNTKALNLSFVDKKIMLSPPSGDDTTIVMQVKNTGTEVWKRNNISLNVVGGATANKIFRHPSWISDLRPALLDNPEVRGGDTGTFTFIVKGLPQGVHTLSIMAVEVGTWTQIGDEESTITFSVGKFAEEKPSDTGTTTTQKNTNPLEGIVKGIKDFADSVIDKVTDVFKSIPKIFGGGSHRDTNSTVNSVTPWVTITSPNSAVITNQTKIQISGERSPNAEIRVNAASSTIEYPSEITWRTEVNLVPGEQIVEVAAQSSKESVGINVIYDAVSPQKPALSANIQTTSTIALGWHAVDTGGSPEIFYTVEKKIDSGEWEKIFQVTTATSYLFTSELFHEYAFRVQAVDSAGNMSGWSDEIGVIDEWNKEIVFNEIAWAGSSGVCSDHEWIELYNPSNSIISIQDWKLEVNNNDVAQSLLLTGSVNPHGFYLISHPNTFVSAVTPDIALPQNIHLSDGGARLILKNQAGDTIDEINQSTGWFGGNTGAYPHTLERIVVESPSFTPRTWRSNESVRYGITSGSCGQITGSPRMSNTGYAYVSDETLPFYSRSSEGNIIFSKNNNPYLFGTITVHEKEKMTFEPGVVFAGAASEAQIIVQGELSIEGSEDEPVIITSRNDFEYVSSTPVLLSLFTGQTPQAGEWQNIVIENTGKFTADYALFKYGGNRYGVSVSCQTCGRSQVISNQGGVVGLSNVEISNGYESGSIGKPDAFIYSETGVLKLNQIKLHHGRQALYTGERTHIEATGVSIDYFDLAGKTVYFGTLPDMWTQIEYGPETPSYAYSPVLTVTSSYTLTNNDRFEFSTVSINPGAILTVNGGNLYASIIKINGSLNVFGGEAEGGGIGGGASPSSTFSHIVFYPGSSGNFSRARIRGGGYFSGISEYPFTSSRPYMLWIDGASVTIANSQLIDSRRTGGVIVVRNGNLDIRDSELGWYSDYNKQPTWKDYGIVGNNQSTVHLENVNFRKMDYVIELNQGSTMGYERMTKDNFINLYKPDPPQKNWFPVSLFPFQLW